MCEVTDDFIIAGDSSGWATCQPLTVDRSEAQAVLNTSYHPTYQKANGFNKMLDQAFLAKNPLTTRQQCAPCKVQVLESRSYLTNPYQPYALSWSISISGLYPPWPLGIIACPSRPISTSQDQATRATRHELLQRRQCSTFLRAMSCLEMLNTRRITQSDLFCGSEPEMWEDLRRSLDLNNGVSHHIAFEPLGYQNASTERIQDVMKSQSRGHPCVHLVKPLRICFPPVTTLWARLDAALVTVLRRNLQGCQGDRHL